MNEHDLMEALQEQASDVAVGPAPLDSMTRSATTTRRRRLVAGVAVAAAVVIGAVGVISVLPEDDSASDPATPAASESAGPPAGFRYAGLDGVAIEVPTEWPTNAHRCSEPTESTVLVDLGPTCIEYPPYPAETDSVDIRKEYDGEDFSTWTPVEIDGLDALRSPDETEQQASGPQVYNGRVYLPGEEVVFWARSSVGPERVDDLLDGIVALDDQAGVPETGDLDLYRQGRRADELYLTRLEAAGLAAEIVRQRDPSYEPGSVISVDPAPGTVVDARSTVTVTVTEGPASPGP